MLATKGTILSPPHPLTLSPPHFQIRPHELRSQRGNENSSPPASPASPAPLAYFQVRELAKCVGGIAPNLHKGLKCRGSGCDCERGDVHARGYGRESVHG